LRHHTTAAGTSYLDLPLGRPVAFVDVDGTLWPSGRRRYQAYLDMIEKLNRFFYLMLEREVAILPYEVFWKRLRSTGDIACVVLGASFNFTTDKGRILARNIREEYEESVARYTKEQLAADSFPPEFRRGTARLLRRGKVYAVTFRTMERARLCEHFRRLGLINGGGSRGMFRENDVVGVGGKGMRSYEAKSKYIIHKFGPLIDLLHKIGCYPIFVGDAIRHHHQGAAGQAFQEHLRSSVPQVDRPHGALL